VSQILVREEGKLVEPVPAGLRREIIRRVE
jgi:hypothetical protein